MTGPVPDIQYGVIKGEAPSAHLLVDYDAARLPKQSERPMRCAELADLVSEGLGPFQHICLTVFPFTAKRQLRRDIAAGSRLLRDDGILDVRLTERRLLPSIRRELEAAFSVVEKLGPLGFRCHGRRAGLEAPLPEDTQEVIYADRPSGRTLSFRNTPGLFSFEAVDAGTHILLDTVAQSFPDLFGRRVLDVGCGYGVVGCTLAARGAQVTMLDSDARAVNLARANLAANGLVGETITGDASVALPDGPFDLVVSNPPTHAGSATLRRLFDLSAAVGRTVVIVIRDILAYERWFKGRYQTECLARRDGYKVIAFRKT
jgi:16S rRNA G1207 methylase RsmC